MSMLTLYEPSEYLRPWKLFTLFLGIALLVLGSYVTPAPDWDIPISLIMAFFTYLAAPWSLHVILKRQWACLPVMAFVTWFSVDGCYAIYWHLKDPAVLALMREANLPASLSLYGICGAVWLYRGSMRELLSGLRSMYKP